MEIDAGNNVETFKMGNGAEEAIEVNDFQNVSICHTFRAFHQASPGDFSLRVDDLSYTSNWELFFMAGRAPLTRMRHASCSEQGPLLVPYIFTIKTSTP